MRRDKKLLSDRKVAILITVVIAILATMLGVYRTSVRYTRNIEALFYDGVYLEDEGYREQSINAHLDNSAGIVLRLATLLESYPELTEKTEDLLSARRELIAAKDIKGKSLSYDKMRLLFVELTSAATRVDLSDRDREAISQDVAVFNGASIAMIRSSYNDKVTEYFTGRSALARMLGAFTPNREPSFFLTTH